MLTIAGDASRDVASNASGSALIAVVVLPSIAAVGAPWFARHRGSERSPVAWFAALGSIAVCISFTLFREGLRFGFQPTGLFAWTTSGWDRLGEGDLIGSSQFLLNVALFVPAGIALTWLTARPLRTLTGLTGLTMLIESTQGVTGAGGADITDVAANTLGASLGVGAAAIATKALFRSGSRTDTTSNPRRRAIAAVSLVVLVAVTAAALMTGADRRQASVRDDLESAFADTTYDEVNSILRAGEDNVEPLDDSARFVDANQIFGAISVRSNGTRYEDDRIDVRWPAFFFGFRRCVFVSWTPSSVDFINASGRACTEFIS